MENPDEVTAETTRPKTYLKLKFVLEDGDECELGALEREYIIQGNENQVIEKIGRLIDAFISA